VLPGYFFAQSLSLAQMWLSRIGLFILFFILIIVLFYWVKRLLVRHGPDFVVVLRLLGKSILQAILNNAHIRKWQINHPGYTAFIRARTTTDHFFGLPLSLLVLSLVYVLGLFGGTVETVLNSELIVSVDIRLSHLLTAYRTDELTAFFTWITRFGNAPVVIVFCLSALTIFWLSRQKRLMIPLLVSVLGSTVFTFLGKLAFHRARPDTAIYLEQSLSFPSGHATIALAFYGFIAWAMTRNLKNISSKINVLLAAVGIVFMIGFSRLYLGEHYLSDVWGGYLAGAMWLIFSVIIVKWRESAPEHALSTSSSAPAAENGRIKGSIALFALVFYVGFAGFYEQTKVPDIPQATSKVLHPIDVVEKTTLSHTLTVLGTEQEPVNLIFVVPSEETLFSALKKSGWQVTGNSTEAPITSQLSLLLSGQTRGSLPLSLSFWNNRVQSGNWVQTQAKASYAHSTHLKIWSTDKTLASGERLFVGMTNTVSGLSWKLFPRIDPDLDQARQEAVTSLQNNLLSPPPSCIISIHPESGHNFVGDPFYTDGKLCIVHLKP
jgi:undecaprenyl-diphosphatase